jgi:magnesium-protoporphyrin O-methyltransferase
MTCHAHCCAVEDVFDRTAARRDLEQYRKKGPSASTRILLNAIQDAGVTGARVLDVGGGIGAIAHELLGGGAASANLVDASAAYLAAARDEAERRQAAARLDVTHGDFVALSQSIASAEIVTLDKVVCCYPDMQQLLGASTARATRLLGIVYPRDGWWIRAATIAQNAFWRLRNSAFRLYIFPNTAIDAGIRSAGFVLRTRNRGLTWVVALYERPVVLRSP